MTLSYTQRLHLAVPDFLSEPWHAEFAAAMESIDRTIAEGLVALNTSLWLNSTVYAIGDVVISPETGSMYACAIGHTSTAAPTTFTQELALHPSFWTSLSGTSLATQAEAEAGSENSHYMSPLRTREAIAAQIGTSPTFPFTAVTVTSNVTLDGSYLGKTVFANATAGNVTITFPAMASLPTDFWVTFVRTDGSANLATINFTGGVTVNGLTSGRLISQYDQVTIQRSGAAFLTRDAKYRARLVIYNSGSNTFTILAEIPLGCSNYQVEAWGGGASGAGGNVRLGGGGAGSYGRRIVTTVTDTSLACTVGVGGTGVTSGGALTAGNPGTSSTVIGTNLGTLTAGGGGGAPTDTSGGNGGTTSGTWNESIVGGAGTLSGSSTSGAGLGGSAPRGGPGGRSNVNVSGSAPGGGGSGGNHVSGTSGSGATGRIIITIV